MRVTYSCFLYCEKKWDKNSLCQIDGNILVVAPYRDSVERWMVGGVCTSLVARGTCTDCVTAVTPVSNHALLTAALP